MPTTQKIIVHATGQVSAMQSRNPQHIDLRRLGQARIRRATEIVFCDTAQQWYVVFTCKNDYLAKVPTTNELYRSKEDKAYYESYSDAVADEIAYINALDPRSEEYRHVFPMV